MRFVAPVTISDFHSIKHDEHRTELDSHADTCVVGKHCLITHTYDKKVNVSGYDPTLGSMNGMSIVSAALAYDDPTCGETIVLRVHQAVHIPSMGNNLLCPMQMRMNDVIVDDCPKFLHHQPADTTHSITVMNRDDKQVIPLSIRGVTSYFPTRTPTALENDNCQSYDLTFAEPTWDPASDTFEKQEEAQVDSHGRVREQGDRISRRFISSNAMNDSLTPPCYETQCAAVLLEIEPALDDHIFVQMLKQNVQVGSTTRVHPMAKKSNAHDGLSLMFARDGVPNCLIMDNSKEQTLGEFRKKAREADCWIKQT